MNWREQKKTDRKRKSILKKRQFNKDNSKWRKRYEKEKNLQKRRGIQKEVNNLENVPGDKVDNDK